MTITIYNPRLLHLIRPDLRWPEFFAIWPESHKNQSEILHKGV
jgi:hypothetical protein